MNPIFKYSGGKKRECKLLQQLTFTQINKAERIVEPFAGSAAFSFSLEKPALISDVRSDVINVYNVVQHKKKYYQLQKKIDELKLITDVKLLEKEFYHQRDDMWKTDNDVDNAFRFIVIRQLVFSGIDRVNPKTGKENAPFGWYKKFDCNLTIAHHNLLQNWQIKLQDVNETFKQVKNTDFIFSDPPYINRNNSYGGKIMDDIQWHKDLQKLHTNANCNWLLVHCADDVYHEFATKNLVHKKAHQYSQNFKGRDNTKQKTEHWYIQNHT